MDEYISKTKFEELMRKKARSNFDLYYVDKSKRYHAKAIGYSIAADEAHVFPASDVPVNQCKMIPQKPDCRGYTDTFFCTNCQIHIHLGFIGQRYDGNYCIECGAKVEDGDPE